MGTPKYKIGDRVIVSDDLQEGRQYFFERESESPFMVKSVIGHRKIYKGDIAEITKVIKTASGHFCYILDIDGGVYVWPASMLLPAPDIKCNADMGILFE